MKMKNEISVIKKHGAALPLVANRLWLTSCKQMTLVVKFSVTHHNALCKQVECSFLNHLQS